MVVSDRRTVWAEAYDPGAGEKLGVAEAGRLTVYVPVATSLFVQPVATAIALIVVVDETAMGADAEYRIDAVVGVDPLVV